MTIPKRSLSLTPQGLQGNINAVPKQYGRLQDSYAETPDATRYRVPPRQDQQLRNSFATSSALTRRARSSTSTFSVASPSSGNRSRYWTWSDSPTSRARSRTPQRVVSICSSTSSSTIATSCCRTDLLRSLLLLPKLRSMVRSRCRTRCGFDVAYR